ncbi:MAG TPA: hypothetical protein VF188_04725 [Longimicrobiales bacterium]
MKRPTEAIRSLARRLLAHEIAAGPSVEDVVAGADVVLRKLSAHLVPLIGPAGFQVLLARALHLARQDFPLLEDVRSGEAPNAPIEGLDGLARGSDPDELRDAVTAVLADFFGLLAHFIGDVLTVRIVSRAWPGLPPGTAGSVFEGEAE